MILEHWIIIGLGILVVVLAYTTINLLIKNEKYEDVIEGYRSFILKYQQQMNDADKRLQEIDKKGLFKSDDEIGWFFTELKKLWEHVTNFKIEA